MSKQLFHTGQEIICINDDFSWARKKYPTVMNYPRFGNRYTVRGYACGGPKPAVLLQEITNISVVYSDGKIRESGFWDGRFVAASPPIKREVKLGDMATKLVKELMSMAFESDKEKARKLREEEKKRGCHCEELHSLPVWHCPVHGEVIVPMD